MIESERAVADLFESASVNRSGKTSRSNLVFMSFGAGALGEDYMQIMQITLLLLYITEVIGARNQLRVVGPKAD